MPRRLFTGLLFLSRRTPLFRGFVATHIPGVNELDIFEGHLPMPTLAGFLDLDADAVHRAVPDGQVFTHVDEESFPRSLLGNEEDADAGLDHMIGRALENKVLDRIIGIMRVPDAHLCVAALGGHPQDFEM